MRCIQQYLVTYSSVSTDLNEKYNTNSSAEKWRRVRWLSTLHRLSHARNLVGLWLKLIFFKWFVNELVSKKTLIFRLPVTCTTVSKSFRFSEPLFPKMRKWEPETREASTLALSRRQPLLNLLGTVCFSAIWLPQVVGGMNATCILLRHSVVSDPLRPRGLQLARLPCPSPSPRACSNSCPLSQWCHPTISSSVIPFSCLQPFPASGSFLMSRLFASGGQSFGASASASVLPMNIQDLFPLGLIGLISLKS